MQHDSFIGLVMFMAILNPIDALGDPQGVWIPANPGSMIERIHISGSPFNYTATIDYRCSTGVCSTYQSLIEDGAHVPPVFSVSLEGAGPAPMLELRWQSGRPCNRAKSDENPLAYWATTTKSSSGKAQAGAVGRTWCFVHPQAPASSR